MNPKKQATAAIIATLGAFAFESNAAAEQKFQKLTGAQIQAKFSGMELTDEAHWGEVFERNGTLTITSREAGVSHAAPKNHFGDVMGLLSDLAAVGFARFRGAMEAHIRTQTGGLGPCAADAKGRARGTRASGDIGQSSRSHKLSSPTIPPRVH
jgi:hypothetical protein